MHKLVIVAMLLAIFTPAFGAEMQYRQNAFQRDTDGAQMTIITIEGQIVPGDDKRFQQIAINEANAIVALNSPGGSLIDGIEIGTTIHNKHFATLVDPGNSCASACALIWLAGDPRIISKKASVGMHAASVDMQVSGPANALVGHYIALLGFGYDLTLYFTEPNPNSIRWLRRADADRLHVTYTEFDSDDSNTQFDPEQPPKPPPQYQAPRQAQPQPRTYPRRRSVGGIDLGSYLSNADPSLGCKPSNQWIGAFWCHTREYKTTSDGGLWAGKTVLLAANGSVLYVNKEFSPTYFHPGELQKQLNDLIRTHPGETPRYIRNGGGICAVWGDLDIQPVDPTARSLIAADRSPYMGVLLATIYDLKAAAANGIPVYHVVSGVGFGWCANDTPHLDYQRFFAIDGDALSNSTGYARGR
jgi:hypothetical protein